MDWKLPPRDPRPHHPGERRTPPPRHPRVRLLSPGRPRPRLLEQRHAQWTSDRAKASGRCQTYDAATPRRPTPSVHVAASGVAQGPKMTPSSPISLLTSSVDSGTRPVHAIAMATKRGFNFRLDDNRPVARNEDRFAGDCM